MTESLWPQLRLEAETEEELIEKYRRVYLDTYVHDERGNPRVFQDWSGCEYVFSERAFDHAFSESNNYRTDAGIHHKYSKKRLRRMLWIREVLAHSAGSIKRYSQLRKTDRGRQAKRRTLVVVEERYVVVFDDPRTAGMPHHFVTAFPADPSYIDRIHRESFLAESRPPPKAKPQK